jgi:hypothetical protein
MGYRYQEIAYAITPISGLFIVFSKYPCRIALLCRRKKTTGHAGGQLVNLPGQIRPG